MKQYDIVAHRVGLKALYKEQLDKSQKGTPAHSLYKDALQKLNTGFEPEVVRQLVLKKERHWHHT